jgi:hypothetical protein
MSCELWARGTADTGYQVVPADLKVQDLNAPYDIPALIPRATGTFGRGTYTQYSNGTNPTFKQTGWYTIELYRKGDCTSGVAANQPFDCLNGGCIPKTTYNTPGKYASLAACRSGCAKDSNCAGECVSAAEIAALQQAANLVRNKLCG